MGNMEKTEEKKGVQVELAFGKLTFGDERQIALLACTEMQRNYLFNLLKIDPETGKYFTKKKAALKAGFSESVANNPKHGIENYIGLQREEAILKDKFHNLGVTEEKIIGKISELLDMTETEFIKKINEDGTFMVKLISEEYEAEDGQTKKQKSLKSVYEKKIKPDKVAVTKAIELWAKLTGSFAPEKTEEVEPMGDILDRIERENGK